MFDAEGYVRLMNLELKLAQQLRRAAVDNSDLHGARPTVRGRFLEAPSAAVVSVGRAVWKKTRGGGDAGGGMRELSKALPLNGRSPDREGPAVRIEAGKEEEFHYLRSWLASSEWLDRLIAATEARPTTGIGLSRSPGLHFTGPAVLTAGRRLLQWSGEAAPARVGKS